MDTAAESPADTPPLKRAESDVEFPSDSESPPHDPSPQPHAKPEQFSIRTNMRTSPLAVLLRSSRSTDLLRPTLHSPNNGTIVPGAAAMARHKRSPAAPSPRTTSSSLSSKEKVNQRVGQTWAAGQDPRIQERADAAGVGGGYGVDVGGYGGMGQEEVKAIESERAREREREKDRED
ncbi:hypothetical protein FRC07_003634 [Ceratobasidium sp. 392]|nr:hypothetical protein FRC07_003634 [Ceratobasidium sp. 392]